MKRGFLFAITSIIVSLSFAQSSIHLSPTYSSQTNPYVPVVAQDANGKWKPYKRALSAFTGSVGSTAWADITGKPDFYYQTVAAIAASTSLTSPLIIGGSGTTQALTLKATTGTGTTGADIIGVSGTNGGTEIFRGTNAGNFGIGTGSTVTAKLEVLATTQQQRWYYNGSNYGGLTIGSTGNATWDLVGTGPQWTFSQLANFNNGFRTNSTSDNSNIAVPTAQGTVTSTTNVFAGASTIHYRVLFRGNGSSAINANTGYTNVLIGGSPVSGLNTGTAHPLFASLVIIPPAVTPGTTPITETSTVYITAAPTGGTGNNALHIISGNSRFDGGVTASQYKLSAFNTAPSSATDTGTQYEVRITSTYIYVCTATNTWVRAALSTW